MEKVYTLNEVVDLQNQKQHLSQRLAIHGQRAIEKQKELEAIFAAEGVTNIDELNNKCALLNQEMQDYARKEAETIRVMKEHCDELDRML